MSSKAKGGITKGKSHAEGGIPMVVKSTGQKVELEGGEGVINKKNMADTKKHEFEGKMLTKCEIASEINSDGGNGVEIDCDGIVGKKYKHEEGGRIFSKEIHDRGENIDSIYDLSYSQLLELVHDYNDNSDNEELAKEISKIQEFEFDAVDYADFNLVVEEYLNKHTNSDEEAQDVLIQAYERTNVKVPNKFKFIEPYAKGGGMFGLGTDMMSKANVDANDVYFFLYEKNMEGKRFDSAEEVFDAINERYATGRVYHYSKKSVEAGFNAFKNDNYAKGGEIEEWSIQTDNEDEHFDNEDEATEFWKSLSEKERKSGQYFRKSYFKNEDGEYEEDEVEIIEQFAKGGVPYSKRFFDIVEYSKDGTIVRKIENKNTYEAEDIFFKLNNTNPVRSGYHYVKMEERFAKGGKVSKKYKVFNYTDNIYASNQTFNSIAEAKKFIKDFRKRFEAQGYYRDNRWNKIAPQHIDLEVIKANFNPYRFEKGGDVKALKNISKALKKGSKIHKKQSEQLKGASISHKAQSKKLDKIANDLSKVNYAEGGELKDEQVQYGSWYVEISEDENNEEIRNQEVARLIREGYFSGFEPTWSLEITDIDGDIDEPTQEEIARLVEEGYTSGEVVMYKYAKGGMTKSLEVEPPIAYIKIDGGFFDTDEDTYDLVNDLLKKHNIEIDNSKDWHTQGYAMEEVGNDDDSLFIKVNMNDAPHPKKLKQDIINLPSRIDYTFTYNYAKGGNVPMNVKFFDSEGKQKGEKNISVNDKKETDLRGMTPMNSEMVDSLPPNAKYIDTIKGVEIYKDKVTDSYYFKLADGKFAKGGSIDEFNKTYKRFEDNIREAFGQPRQNNIVILESDFGFKRSELPQLRTKDKGLFTKMLVSKYGANVVTQDIMVKAKLLKPIQSEINLKQVEVIAKVSKGKMNPNKPITISKDGYIIDGHHRWYYAQQNDLELSVLQINLDANKVIDEIWQSGLAEKEDIDSVRKQNGGKI